MSAPRLTYVPTLITLLLDAEKRKGSPLTDPEVLAVRDGAKAVTLTPEEAEKVEQEQGYEDLDPENCWSEWQHVRLQFLDAQ